MTRRNLPDRQDPARRLRNNTPDRQGPPGGRPASVHTEAVARLAFLLFYLDVTLLGLVFTYSIGLGLSLLLHFPILLPRLVSLFVGSSPGRLAWGGV